MTDREKGHCLLPRSPRPKGSASLGSAGLGKEGALSQAGMARPESGLCPPPAPWLPGGSAIQDLGPEPNSSGVFVGTKLEEQG